MRDQCVKTGATTTPRVGTPIWAATKAHIDFAVRVSFTAMTSDVGRTEDGY